MTTELVTVGWQSVEDCLPLHSSCVLATDGDTYYIASYSTHTGWEYADDDLLIDSHITHWRELPLLPGEEEQ